MHHHYFAWVRLFLLIILILAFAYWLSACEREYQLQQSEQTDPIIVTVTQEEPQTTTPSEAETAPEPTFTEPPVETTPPTEPATEPPTEPTEPADPTPPPTEPPVESPLEPTEPTEPEQPMKPPIPGSEPEELRYQLTDEERAIVEAVVAAEARGEDFLGQVLVALCILNTAEEQGIRPDQVVLALGQYTTPTPEYRDLVKDAVSAVFDHGYAPTSEPIQFFYAHKRGFSGWHEYSLVFVLEHGGHRFFKLP